MVLSVQAFVDSMNTEVGRQAFAALTPAQKTEQLTQFDSWYKCYPLTYVLRFGKRDAVMPIMEAIQDLEDTTKREILFKADGYGWRAIDYAKKYYPAAVERLLNMIDRLDGTNLLYEHAADACTVYLIDGAEGLLRQVFRSLEYLNSTDKETILLKKSSNGWNALMVAARYHPEAVVPLLGAIERLPEGARQTILMEKNSDGLNALMLAAYYHPEAVEPLLGAIDSLPEGARQTILLKKSSDGWNALMVAARYQPEAVEALLRAIEELSEGARQTILTDKNNYGWNALMVAARYQPEAVEALLRAIEELSEGARQTILMEKNNYGWNALMLAARYQPEAVEPLLGAIEGLPEGARQAILVKKTSKGSNALMLAARYQPDHPEAAGLILDMIDRVFELDSDESSSSYDELLQSYYLSKTILFNAIKTLPEERQIILLKKCIDPNTTLGRKMWAPWGATPCSLSTGTLNKIVDHLKILDPTFEVSDVELKDDLKTSVSGIQLALEHALSTHTDTHVAGLLQALKGLNEGNEQEREVQLKCLDYFENRDVETLDELSRMVDSLTPESTREAAAASGQGLFSSTALEAFKAAFNTFKAEEARLLKEDDDDLLDDEGAGPDVT